MAVNFPIPAFNFKVEIEGSKFLFSEVSGLKISTEFQEVRSGGINNMHFKIPTKTTLGEITLKRGVFSKQASNDASSDKLLTALKKKIDFESPNINTKKQFDNIVVTLVSDKPNSDICTWTLISPVLISWEISPFNASSNELAFETLVFHCASLKMKYF